MKLNKKIMSVHLLICLLLSQNAMARISAGERKPSGSAPSTDGSGSTRSQAPSSIKVSQATKDNYQVVSGTTAICKGAVDEEKYFPLSFFQEIQIEQRLSISKYS